MPEGYVPVTNDELSPDPGLIADQDGEIGAEPLPIRPVPVETSNVVYVRQTPMEYGRPIVITLTAVSDVIMGDDPRRAYVTLMAPSSLDPGFIVSTDRATVDLEALAMWPVQRECKLEGPGKIYAKAAGGLTCRLTIIPVYWAN